MASSGGVARTRALALALPLLALVAGLSVWQLLEDVREYAADPDLAATVRPLWFHAAAIARTASRLVLTAALCCALLWRHAGRRSSTALRIGWLCALALYVAPVLVPNSWTFRPEAYALPEARTILQAAAPAFALAAYLDLAPLPASLCVGFSRAGLRMLRVEPGHAKLALVAVFFASLLLAATLATVLGFAMPLANEALLLVGLALLLAHYVLATAVAGALLGQPSRPRLRHVLTGSALTLVLGGTVCVLLGLAHVEVLGKHLVKWGATDGFFSPVAVAVVVVEFAGRAVVTAVAASDLLADAIAAPEAAA